MAKPSAKIPRITNADKAGLVADPGTLVFNNDSDMLEFINQAFNFVPTGGYGNTIAQLIWVNAASGNDSNPGGFNSPFATYDAARLFAKTIASPTNIVVISIIGDQSITGDFIISPYIVVNGNKSGVFTITGDIILDTDFLPLSSLITKVVGCAFIANALTITWGAGDQNILVFNESDFVSVPTFTEVSPNTNAFGNGVAIIGSIQPFYLPFNTLFSIKDALFAASNCQLAGLPELIATGAQSPRMSFIQSGGYGQITVDGSGAAGSPIVFLRSCDPTGVNLNSTNALLATDVVSLNNDALNFAGGATVAQVQFNTQLEPSLISTSLFTPSNYTPASPDSRVGPNSITSHLNGINTALAGVSAPDFQDVWNNGTPGQRGSFTVTNADSFAVFNADFGVPQISVVAVNFVDPNLHTLQSWGYDYYGTNLSTSLLQYARTEANVTNPANGAETAEWRLYLKNAGANVVGFYVPPGGANPEFANGTKHVAAVEDIPALGSADGAITISQQINSTGATVVSSKCSRVGNIGTFSAKITFNATSGLPTIILAMPFTTGFTAPGQASGNATVLKTPPMNNIGDGVVSIVDSVSGVGVQFSAILAASSGSYDMYVCGTYLIN